MMQEYRLLNILHSGKKGERGTPVSQDKYDGMIGSSVILDADELELEKSFTFWFERHPFYRNWTTSPVLSYTSFEDTKHLAVETLNSIYTFEYIGEFKRKRVEVKTDEI